MPGAYGALGTIRRELRSSKKRLAVEQERFTRLQQAESILSSEVAADGTGEPKTNGRRPRARGRGRPRKSTRRTKRSRATTTA